MAAGTAPKKTSRTKATKGPAPSIGPVPTGDGEKKIQVVAMVDPEMVAALDAFQRAHGLKSRSEAVRVFLGYGRTQAERYLASAATARPSVPARAPRSNATSKRSA